MDSKCFSYGDLILHYLDWGGTGEPVLCLHGTGGNARLWGFLACRLAGHFRVLALDFHGHGESSKPAAGYDKRDYLADVVAWINHLGSAPFALVGYSLGALVTIVLAATQPELVSRAVLVDPSIGAPDIVLEQYRRIAATAPLSFPNREKVEDYFYQKYGRLIDDNVLKDFIEGGLSPDPACAGYWCWKHSRQAAVETFASRREDNHLYLPRITCPTLFIRGRDSLMFSPRGWRDVQALQKPNFYLREVPGSDHGIILQQPALVAELAAAFLAGDPLPANRS